MKTIKNYLTSANLLWDAVFVALLSALSIFHIFFYLHADYLNTFYQDWMVHAFRIKLLQQYGLISWTHIWANGINIWRAYQFAPHLLTLGLVDLFHLPITRAMVVMTVLLFILFRFFIYIPLRSLGFSPMVAFICTILSFDIAQYWGGVADYSLMFGFVLFPLGLTLWIAYTKGKVQNIFPFIIGLFFYVHPLLGFLSATLWAVSLLQSKTALFSFEHGKQLLIIMCTSSLFWLPIVYKPSFVYTSSNIASKYFLQLVLTAYDYYGLSLAILFQMAIASIQIFLPLPKSLKWVKLLALVTVSYFGLILLGITVDLPRFIGQFQFTRGVTFIGISTAFIIAPIIQWLLKKKIMLIDAGLLFVVVLIAVDGLWISSAFSSQTTNTYEEPLSAYIKANPNSPLKSSRVWIPDIGMSSYSAPDTIQFPYSYMGHLDSNQLSTRIFQLVSYQAYVGSIPQENMDRINDYFKTSGVQYAVFEESSPYTKTFSESTNPKYINLGRINFAKSIYHVFQMPWQPINAALINPGDVSSLQTFPKNLVLETPSDQIKLDTDINQFMSIIYKPDNPAVKVSYPTQETVEATIPANRTTPFVYLAESYDSEWHATYNGKVIPLQAVGPNYMLVKLPDNTSSGKLQMKHTWPITFYLSVAMIIAIPVTILIANLYKFIFARILLKKNKQAMTGIMRPLY